MNCLDFIVFSIKPMIFKILVIVLGMHVCAFTEWSGVCSHTWIHLRGKDDLELVLSPL